MVYLVDFYCLCKCLSIKIFRILWKYKNVIVYYNEVDINFFVGPCVITQIRHLMKSFPNIFKKKNFSGISLYIFYTQDNDTVSSEI